MWKNWNNSNDNSTRSATGWDYSLCSTSLLPEAPITADSRPTDVLSPCLVHALLPSLAALAAALCAAWLLLVHGCLSSGREYALKRPIRVWAWLPMAKITISGIDLLLAHILMAMADPADRVDGFRERYAEAMANILFSAFATFCYLASVLWLRMHTSIGLHFAWLIRTLTLLPAVFLTIPFSSSSAYSSISLFYLLHFLCALSMLFLLCWADPLFHSNRRRRKKKAATATSAEQQQQPKVYISLTKENAENAVTLIDTDQQQRGIRKTHPESRCSAISALLYAYAGKIIGLAVEGRLATMEGLWPMEKKNQSLSLSEKFVTQLPAGEHQQQQKLKLTLTPFHLVLALLSCTWEWLLRACLYISIFGACRFSTVIFLGVVVQSVQAGHPLWLILLALFGLFALDIAGKLCWQRADYNAYIGGHCNVGTLLTMAIYDKMMRLSAVAKSRYSAGQLQTLLNTDVGCVKEWFFSLYDLVYCPTIIIISLLGLYSQLGWSALLALAVVLAMFPVNYLFSKLLAKFQVQLIELIGQRLELVSDVVAGIKTLKLNVWEPCFEQRIEQIRRAETRTLRTLFLIGTVQDVSVKLCPILATIAAFFAFTVLQQQRFRPEVAFMSLLFIGMLKYSVFQAPNLVTTAIRGWVSARRICLFLNETELQQQRSPPASTATITIVKPGATDVNDGDTSGCHQQQVVVSMRNCSFSWGNAAVEGQQNNEKGEAVATVANQEEQPLTSTTTFSLASIHMEVQRGKLVAIVGKVGSGKSSLLLAILGEMLLRNDLSSSSAEEEEKNCCHFQVHADSIGYVPQQAWIAAGTVRENILLQTADDNGPAVNDDDSFLHVLQACALNQELKQLRAGDQTLLGEKGANLSGGQKARIGLARAVCHNADLYLLDDTLASVDAQVAKQLFDQVIGPSGLLHTKTRVMALNTLAFLPRFDRIYVLDEGRIVAVGTLDELSQHSAGPFVELMRRYVQEKAEESARKKKQKEVKVPRPDEEEQSETESVQEELMEQMLARIQGSPLAKSLETQINALRFAIRWKNKFRNLKKNKWGKAKKEENKMPTEEASEDELKDESEEAMTKVPADAEEITTTTTMEHHSADGELKKQPLLEETKEMDGEGKEEAEEGEDDEEEIPKGKLHRRLYLDYVRAFGRRTTVLFLCLSLLSPVFGALANWWLALWAEGMEEGGKLKGNNQGNGTAVGGEKELAKHYNARELAIYALLNFLCVLATGIAGVISAYGIAYASLHLHSALVHSVLCAPLAFFEGTKNSLGRILNRFSADIERLDFTIPAAIANMAILLGEALTFLLAICLAVPYAGLLVCIPLCLLFMQIVNYFNAAAVHFSRMTSKSRSALFSAVLAAHHGAECIRAYKLVPAFRLRTCRALDASNECYSAEVITNRWLQIRLDMLAELPIFICVLTTTLLCTQGIVSVSALAMVIGTGFTFMAFLGYMARQWRTCESEMVGLERIQEWIGSNSNGQEKEATEECKLFPEGKDDDGHLPTSEDQQEGHVEFRDVCLRYNRPTGGHQQQDEQDASPLCLDGVSFRVESGQKIGIVGRTASGKSSLLVALSRLHEPCAGEILINGRNIQQIGLQRLRKAMTIVPQEPCLFRGSLRSNLDPARQFPDHRLWEVMDLVEMSNFARSKEEKLEFLISDGGSNLSLGQRQLLCLARALLHGGGNAKNPKIIVLDEPTSALDPDTEARIQRVIGQQFATQTVLTISHRVQSVMDSSDKVLVMDKGRVVAFDTPQQLLLQPDSVFAKMVKDAGGGRQISESAESSAIAQGRDQQKEN